MSLDSDRDSDVYKHLWSNTTIKLVPRQHTSQQRNHSSNDQNSISILNNITPAKKDNTVSILTKITPQQFNNSINQIAMIRTKIPSVFQITSHHNDVSITLLFCY